MTTAGKVKPPEDFFKTQMKRDEFDEDDDDTGVEPLISLSFKGIQVRMQCMQQTLGTIMTLDSNRKRCDPGCRSFYSSEAVHEDWSTAVIFASICCSLLF